MTQRLCGKARSRRLQTAAPERLVERGVSDNPKVALFDAAHPTITVEIASLIPGAAGERHNGRRELPG
jgi:hypothetical protein